MKKILLCASILALAVVGCTDNEFDSTPGQKNASKGISFTGVMEQNSPETRGEFEFDGTKFDYKWYAEKDRIKLFADTIYVGVDVNGNPITTPYGGGVGYQEGFNKDIYATYKATQTERTARFTAISDNDILNFASKHVSTPDTRFFAVYPSTVGVEEFKFIDSDSKKGIESALLKTLPLLTGQVQDGLGLNPATHFLMYDYAAAKPAGHNNGVGETAPLRLKRPFPFVRLNIANLEDYSNADVNPVFGNLQSIELIAKGYDKDGDGDYTDEGDIYPSMLDYGTGGFYLINPADETKSMLLDSEQKELAYNAKGQLIQKSSNPEVLAKFTNPASSVTVAIDQAWGSSDYAFMAINGINRKPFSADKKEAMSARVVFDNIEFNVNLVPTNSPWAAHNGSVNITVLDINDHAYLVTNGVSSANRTLIINKADIKVSDFIVDKSGTKYVIWDAADETSASPSAPEVRLVPLGQFSTIKVKAQVSDDVLAALNGFTATIDLNIEKNTELKAKVFENLTALEKINMPAVTKIAADAFASSIELTDVLLPAYGFNEAANATLLNKANLKVLDMSSVERIDIGFPGTGMTFKDYAKLKEVIVKDGIILGANSFSSCVLLPKLVYTASDLSKKLASVTLDGPGVFQNCKEMTEVLLNGTEIPNNSFNGCWKLAKVQLNTPTITDPITPTKVGEQAFKDCQKLVNIHLKSTVEIGKAAFAGCILLKGEEVTLTEGKRNVLEVGVEIISENIFEDCIALEYVDFTKATSFGNGFLDVTKNGLGTAKLQQVKFRKIIEPLTGYVYAGDIFGSDSEAVDLFINKAQPTDNYDETHLILPAPTTADPSAVYSIEFNSVYANQTGE